MLVDIHIGLTKEILDLVDSRLQFSIFKDGMRVTRRAQSHGQEKHNNAENTKKPPAIIIYKCVTAALLPRGYTV